MVFLFKLKKLSSDKVASNVVCELVDRTIDHAYSNPLPAKTIHCNLLRHSVIRQPLLRNLVDDRLLMTFVAGSNHRSDAPTTNE